MYFSRDVKIIIGISEAEMLKKSTMTSEIKPLKKKKHSLFFMLYCIYFYYTVNLLHRILF